MPTATRTRQSPELPRRDQRQPAVLWYAENGQYGTTPVKAYPTGDPKAFDVKDEIVRVPDGQRYRRLHLGVNLFLLQSGAIRAAEAQLQQMADEAHVTVSEMRGQLLAESLARR